MDSSVRTDGHLIHIITVLYSIIPNINCQLRNETIKDKLNAVCVSRTKPLFSSKKFCKINTVAFSFVFDKYSLIME